MLLQDAGQAWGCFRKCHGAPHRLKGCSAASGSSRSNMLEQREENIMADNGTQMHHLGSQKSSLPSARQTFQEIREHSLLVNTPLLPVPASSRRPPSRPPGPTSCASACHCCSC
eukprot:1153382-Pelagomonas_calceolata.AAC.5